MRNSLENLKTEDYQQKNKNLILLGEYEMTDIIKKKQNILNKKIIEQEKKIGNNAEQFEDYCQKKVIELQKANEEFRNRMKKSLSSYINSKIKNQTFNHEFLKGSLQQNQNLSKKFDLFSRNLKKTEERDIKKETEQSFDRFLQENFEQDLLNDNNQAQLLNNRNHTLKLKKRPKLIISDEEKKKLSPPKVRSISYQNIEKLGKRIKLQKIIDDVDLQDLELQKLKQKQNQTSIQLQEINLEKDRMLISEDLLQHRKLEPKFLPQKTFGKKLYAYRLESLLENKKKELYENHKQNTNYNQQSEQSYFENKRNSNNYFSTGKLNKSIGFSNKKNQNTSLMRRDQFQRGCTSQERISRKMASYTLDNLNQNNIQNSLQNEEIQAVNIMEDLKIENGIKYGQLINKENFKKSIHNQNNFQDDSPSKSNSKRINLMKKIQLISSHNENSDYIKSKKPILEDLNNFILTTRLESSINDSPFKPYNEKNQKWSNFQYSNQ